MVWQQIQVLLTSFVGYWLGLTVMACAGWYAWTRLHPGMLFKWQAPVLVASLFSFYGIFSTTMSIYQNSRLIMLQEQIRAAQTAADPKTQAQAQAQVDPVIQMKTNFLKSVEQLISNPTAITAETKNKLKTEYASLFKTDEERKNSYLTVQRFYECQRYFWEDAFAAFKSKVTVKSGDRKACEKEPGGFFQRENLMSAEIVKSNDDIILKLAERKRIPSSDGKELEVNEKMLRETLDAYAQMASAAKTLLQ